MFLWKGKLMQFQTTAFGLAIAPRVFTNLLRTPIALLRRMGIRLIVYMDDILIMNQSYQGVQSDLQTVVAMMEGLGFFHKQSKIGIKSGANNRIARLHGRFHRYVSVTSKGENYENKTVLSGYVVRSVSDC
jgi:hypothetical protein